ncbi:hypothetical protein CerSpe_224240 [Prunus speciosa]
MNTISTPSGSIQGLRLANQSNYFPLIVESDSCLAVDLVNAPSCDPLHPLFTLISSCKAIMTGGVCRIHHVFRESNSVADMLASIGVTKPLGLHTWVTAPAAMNQLIFKDMCRVCIPRLIVP